MKKRFVLFTLFLALLLAFSSAYAQAETDVAKVHILRPGEDMEAKRKALSLPSYYDAPHEHAGDALLVIPATPGSVYELFSVELNEEGKLVLAELRERFTVAKYCGGIVLRQTISETIPNLAVCFMGTDRVRQCWVPRFNGMDGSLMLDKSFSPIREPGENPEEKIYSQTDDPLITGDQLIDQPHVMVGKLKSAEHLSSLAAEYRFAPKGAFNSEMPHHFFFMPLILPTSIRLHAVENRGGDGFIQPSPLREILLNDDEAAVFSLDLSTKTEPNDPDTERSFAFSATDTTTGKTSYWYPSINSNTGKLEGFGLGETEKFIQWPY